MKASKFDNFDSAQKSERTEKISDTRLKIWRSVHLAE